MRTVEYKSREEWLEGRRSFIGGSDAPAVMRLSPYKTPVDVAISKWGLDGGSSAGEAAEWGNLLEPVIRDRVAQKHGLVIKYPGPYVVCLRDDLPWMGCSLDGEVIDPAFDGPGVLQVKTAAMVKAGDWEVEPPMDYQCQIQHEMAVTGRTWGMFAVLFGGQRLELRHVRRHDKFIELLERKERAFWENHVLKQEPPELKSDAEIETWLKANKTMNEGEEVALPDDARQWVERIKELKDQAKLIDKERKHLENQIKMNIGTAEYGLLGGMRIHYKRIVKEEHVVKGSTYRQLYYKGANNDDGGE